MNVGKRISTVMWHEYFEIDPPIIVELDIETSDIASFGLMLPMISQINDDENSIFGVYTVITSDWTEILIDKSFGLSEIPETNAQMFDSGGKESNILNEHDTMDVSKDVSAS